MTAMINRVGQRYGRLTVIEYVGLNPHGYAMWRCLCECGQTTIVKSNNLARGKTRSCGCIKAEQRVALHRTHGQTHSPEHRAWLAMIGRCYEKSNSSYFRYGAKGIQVCDEWRHSFPTFLEHIGPKPSPSHTVDRLDNTRGYEPGNVRWATPQEQANNRRSNTLIEWRGQTKTLAEWGRTTGLPWYMIQTRLRRGWSIDRALSDRQHHVNGHR